MSVLDIGLHDISEQERALKDKIASKGMPLFSFMRPSLHLWSGVSPEGHIAAQDTRLIRQANEIDELRSSLNEAIHEVRAPFPCVSSPSDSLPS